MSTTGQEEFRIKQARGFRLAVSLVPRSFHSRIKFVVLLKSQIQEARPSEETDFLCTVESVCNIKVMPEDMRICSTRILGQSGLAYKRHMDALNISQHCQIFPLLLCRQDVASQEFRHLGPAASSAAGHLPLSKALIPRVRGMPLAGSAEICRVCCGCQIRWSRDFMLILSLVCLAW